MPTRHPSAPVHQDRQPAGAGGADLTLPGHIGIARRAAADPVPEALAEVLLAR
jgi:hypothetical protein